MNIMQPLTDSGQPRPAICPVCGLIADNGVARRDSTRTVSYVCVNAHLFATTWVEVA